MKRLGFIFLVVMGLSACSSSDAPQNTGKEQTEKSSRSVDDVLWKFNSKKPDMPVSK